MTTQWGRDGHDLPRRFKNRIAGLLFVFIAFDVGIIAGFGLSLYFDRENRVNTNQFTDQQAEIQRLEEQLSQASDSSIPIEELVAAEKEVASLKMQLADANLKAAELEKQVADLRAKADEENSKTGELQSVLHENENLKQLLAEKETARQKLDAQRNELQKNLTEAQALVEASALERDSLRAELEKAEKQTIPELQAELAKLRARTASPEQDNEAESPSPGNTPANGLQSRKKGLVLQSLKNAPSLNNLDSAQKEKLVELLVSGACVTTSLKEITGDVPIVLLAHLIKELGGDC